MAVSHGWFQTAPFAWDAAAGRLHRGERLPDGAVHLEMSGDAAAGVRVRASRPLTAPERVAVAARVARMLQLEREVDGLADAAAAVDPRLAADLRDYGGGRLLCGSSLFEDVVKAICGTNVTWRQAVASINRIAGLGRDGAFPEPPDILRAGEDRLRERVRVGYRAPSLVEAARAAIDGRLAEVEEASAAGDAEAVTALLRALPGVGPATAGFLCLLLGHYGRPAVDSATIRVAAAAWFEGRRPAPREVLRRVAPAGEYAGLVLYWATVRGWQRETGLTQA